MDQKGFTTLQINQVNYLWTVNNLEFCLDLDMKKFLITSAKFTDKNKSVWYLKLNRYSEYLTLHIILEECNKEVIQAKYKFSIINKKGEKINTYKNHGIQYIKKHIPFGTSEFIKKVDVLNSNNNLVCNDQLKILCEISVFDEIILNGNCTPEFNMPNCKLYEDFSMIFENKKFSDVTLTVVDGRQFQVHKNILATNSPVFAAMFEHEMEESKHNNVNINDIDYDVLQEVLRFIYTGKIQKLQEMAGEILAAADKYALEALKVVCEKTLYESLSIENAAEMLVLADRYRAEQLKKKVIYFVYINPDVMESKKWMDLKQTHPHLIFGLFGATAKTN